MAIQEAGAGVDVPGVAGVAVARLPVGVGTRGAARNRTSAVAADWVGSRSPVEPRNAVTGVGSVIACRIGIKSAVESGSDGAYVAAGVVCCVPDRLCGALAGEGVDVSGGVGDERAVEVAVVVGLVVRETRVAVAGVGVEVGLVRVGQARAVDDAESQSAVPVVAGLAVAG